MGCKALDKGDFSLQTQGVGTRTPEWVGCSLDVCAHSLQQRAVVRTMPTKPELPFPSASPLPVDHAAEIWTSSKAHRGADTVTISKASETAGSHLVNQALCGRPTKHWTCITSFSGHDSPVIQVLSSSSPPRDERN